MKLLITGAGGQVGKETAAAAAEHGFETAALTHQDLDIADKSAVKRIFHEVAPSMVVNAAAYTAVDKAESEPDLAAAVNEFGPANLAEACRAGGIPLIHLSTDYVFDGNQKRPYRETDPVNPAGVYGRSKAAGEAAVASRLDRHVILRTAWVFSSHGSNFVKTMIRLGRERDAIGVVDDQIGCPTDAAAIARAILSICARYADDPDLPWGTYHFCGAPTVTWYGFANRIFAAAQAAGIGLTLDTLEAITTADYPTAAARPANSVLDCGKIAAAFGIEAPDWRDGLSRVVKELAV
jgi:dTDP-4-dehydrorhamnose reductase